MRYLNQQRELWYSRNGSKSLYGYILFYNGPHIYFSYSI